jgi:DNA-binding protein H-NS
VHGLVPVTRRVPGPPRTQGKKVLEQMLAIAQDAGVSAEELLANTGAKSKAGGGKKVQPRYKNPADNAQTWTGRGRQPKWIADGLANGKTLDAKRYLE